jgi:cytochrome c biogenesis protein CcdA
MEFSTFSVALVAGVLATFNPCGFALLPAYLSALVIGDQDGSKPALAAYGRAARFSAGMAIGLVGVFTAFALIVFPFALSLEQYLPAVTAVIGLALVFFGVQLLRGKAPVLKRLINANVSPRKQFATQIGYGVTFALGSLSCTIGPFLAIAASALASGSLFSIATSFSLYGLGMALTVLILALLTAATNRALISKIRGATPIIEKLTAALVIVVGIYISIYAWFEVQSYAGQVANNPVIDFALSIQTAIIQFVVGLLGAVNLL